MKRLNKVVALVASAALISPTWALTVAPTTTYGGLVWSLSTSVSGLPQCPQVFLDLTGDLVNSSRLSMYGTLNCPASNSSYAITGSAYFGANGTLNMNAMIGGFWQLNCANMVGFQGSCTIQNGSGVILGTAFLRLN
jgi:hypothetical protein